MGLTPAQTSADLQLVGGGVPLPLDEEDPSAPAGSACRPGVPARSW